MKQRILAGILVVMAASAAQATLFSYTYSSGFDPGSGVIPDGNVTGWSDTRTIDAGDFSLGDGTTTEIRDVNVRLNISDGYNGDLYGYLVHSSGFTVLLDRVGTGSGSEPQFTFGYSTSGMNVTLDDSAGSNIHDVETPGAGPYVSDGGTLASFNTLAADGSWTLFLADMSGGDISTVVSWGLDIDVVPEPITWALALFGGVLGAVKLGHHWRRRKTA